MLPIPELVRFGETLDDAWRSPLADAAGRRWGVQRPVFVRSSASHVLVADAGSGERLVLRMRPHTSTAVAVLARGAHAADAWHRAGAPFVAPAPSVEGRLVERVDGYVVTALHVAEGRGLDEAPLDREAAQSWGAALARLHDAGAMPVGATAELPTAEAILAEADLSSELDAVAGRVLRDLAALPDGPEVRGVLHGDPEPDNVVRTTDGPVLVDPDDVRVGWFASDVAFALRDWQDDGGRLDWELDVPAGFLTGYRSVRPLTDEELATVPLHVRAAALEDLGGLQPHLHEPVADDWPAWAVELHARVRAQAARLRRVALAE